MGATKGLGIEEKEARSMLKVLDALVTKAPTTTAPTTPATPVAAPASSTPASPTGVVA
jgi:hypothetical protein